jgi:hypothetical protein
LDPIPLPFRGASNGRAYINQPGDTAPPERLRNVRVFDVSEDRPSMGQRPGVSKAFSQQMANAPVQALGVVSRASSISGYIQGECEPLEGTSKQATALAGQIWLLDAVPSMCADIFIDVTASPYNASGHSGCNAVAADADGTLFAACLNIAAAASASGRGESVLVLFDATGAVLDEVHVTSLTLDKFIDTLVFVTLSDRTILYACSGHDVLVYRAEVAGLTLVETNTMGGWAKQTLEADWYTDGTDTWLYVAFDGANKGGMLPNDAGGGITAGYIARSFRAGVMKFRIGATGALTQVVYGTQLPPTATYFEAAHNYWRIGEQLGAPPWGRYVHAMRVDRSDGSLRLATTNAGWGPRATFPPDGSVGYTNLFKIDAEGELQWQLDTFSIKEAGAANTPHGDYFNDITQASKESTILAVAVDGDGVAWAAGRRQASDLSVFKYTPFGAFELGMNLQGTSDSDAIRQAAAFIDPADGNPIFAGDRNTAWDGAGGANAHLWKVNRKTGAVIWSYDLAAAVSGLCVCAAGGLIVYGTDKV